MNVQIPTSREVINAIGNLLTYYVDRQQIVVAIMIEFRPDIIEGLGINKILNIDITRQYQEWQVRIDGFSFAGIWKNEWEYLFHGHGCRLIHKITKEPLEWNAGHPKSFYIGWFARHADWKLQTQKNEPDIEIYRSLKENKQLDVVFSHMIELDMLIKPPDKNGYFFVR